MKRAQCFGIGFRISRDKILKSCVRQPDKLSGWDGEVDDVSYIDDMEFSIVMETNQITAATKEAIEIIYGIASGLGLVVNFAPGKTETMFRLWGPNSKKNKKFFDIIFFGESFF